MAECVTPSGLCVAYNSTNTAAYVCCDPVVGAYRYQWLYYTDVDGATYKETDDPYCYFDITEKASALSVAYRMSGVAGWCGVYHIDATCSFPYPVVRPTITEVHTSPDTPKLCEPIRFMNTIVWDDDGGTGKRYVWWQYTKSTAEYTTESCGDELSWTQFADTQWPEHTFTEEEKDITHIRCIAQDKNGIRGCAMIENFTLSSTNGFSIRVSDTLSSKTIIVAHVTKMPFVGIVGPDPDLWYWPQAFDYVGGKWYTADPETTYKIPVGSIYGATPSFDKTYGSGSFADGIHCVVLAEGDGGIGSLIFEGKDVFKLHTSSPTCVSIATTSNDVLTEAVMGPVCDFFGISRGSECSMFWAEFYDPVYVANYISILTTGQDTIGTSRELTAIDHLAFPFSVLGSLPGLSLLPFGALITNSLEAMSKGGVRFGDDATQFMLNFSMDASNFVSKKDTWHFLDAMGQVTEAHATEIVNALTAGYTTTAETVLRKYAGESKGWWDYHILDDMLRDALPTDTYNWLRTQCGLPEIGAGTVTNTAKQTTLSADDLAKLADAASDSEVMDEATAAVYKSIIDMPTASVTKVEELANILKNSDEIASRVGAKNVPMERFIDSTTKYHDLITDQLGQTKANSWFKNNAEIATKAIDSVDPEAMADIPHSAQDYAANMDNIIDDSTTGTGVTRDTAEDLIFGDGAKVGDEICDATQVFPDEATTGWYTKARDVTNIVPNRIKAKWAGLERYEKVLVVWFMVDNVAFIIYMIAKFLGLGPGDRGFTAWSLAKSVTDAKWVCKEACDDKRYDDLESGIAILECAITNLENHLDTYEFSLKLSNSYEAPSTICEIGKLALKLYQECLVNKGIEVAPSTGKIVFFAVDTEGQAVTSGAYVDGRRVGTIWGSGLSIDEVDPGNYDLEIKTTGYVGCTKTVSVVANQDSTFECILTQIMDCSEVGDVSIYIDPLSPEEDETISFNGSADSDDAIPSDGWEWDFDDGSPNKVGQAVTHTYSSDRIYEVKLTVTNECGSSRYATRNVTVSEEEEPAESTTLQIETPINEDGNDIDRYWEVEIWVDGKDTACTPPKTLTFGTNVFCDCTSPWNLVECELGQHTVTLKKDGYDDKSISVYLKKDEPKTWYSPVMVESAAAPTMHTVHFSVPEGSNLYIDGVSLRRLSTVTRISELFKSMRK